MMPNSSDGASDGVGDSTAGNRVTTQWLASRCFSVPPPSLGAGSPSFRVARRRGLGCPPYGKAARLFFRVVAAWFRCPTSRTDDIDVVSLLGPRDHDTDTDATSR